MGQCSEALKLSLQSCLPLSCHDLISKQICLEYDQLEDFTEVVNISACILWTVISKHHHRHKTVRNILYRALKGRKHHNILYLALRGD